ERYVKENASVTAAQRLLAATYTRLAGLYCDQRRAVPAERELAKALAILEPLASRHPKVTDIALTLAGCQLHFGKVALDLKDQFDTALPWLDRALERCEVILKTEPRHYGARTYLGWTLAARARCLSQLTRHGEALADWRRALELDGGKD